MTSANNKVSISSIDFSEIKDNLKNFLRNQDQFTDYDFEGSSMSILLDILAYNTYYNSYYLNMVANESFLDTALIRDNIVSIAKHLGYTPRSMSGATAFVNVTVTPTGPNIPSTLTLNQFTQFQSEAINSKNYSFVAANSYTSSISGGTFTFNNVELVQGEPTSYIFNVSGANGRRVFNIPSANIDTNTLVVSVAETTGNTPGTYTYNLTNDITIPDGNTRSFFLEASTEGNYNIYFGDGNIGRNLANGDTVVVSYVVTDGPYGNFANNFTCMVPIGSYGNVVIQSVSASTSGATAETNDSIKKLAPLSYTSQNRVVTQKDYQSFLLSKYPNIDSISVWGGEANVPPVFGKVFISIKPKQGLYLTQIEKTRVVGEILAGYNMPTITPTIIDPDYCYLAFNITANYDPKKTTLNSAQIQAVIRAAVLNYNVSELGKFDSYYRNSKLLQYITNSEPSILGAGVSVFMKKKLIPVLNGSSGANYTVNFNSPLHRGTYNDKLYSSPSFSQYDGNGILRNCFIEETPLSFTSINDILITSPGFSYTSDPVVTVIGDGTGATAIAKIVNGSLNSITIIDGGQGYSIATVTITGGGGYGATAIPVIQAKSGVIRTYYIDGSNKYFLTTKQGTIDYLTGLVTIDNFNPADINNTTKDISIVIQPENEYISPARNRILTMDYADATSVVVNLIADA